MRALAVNCREDGAAAVAVADCWRAVRVARTAVVARTTGIFVEVGGWRLVFGYLAVRLLWCPPFTSVDSADSDDQVGS